MSAAPPDIRPGWLQRRAVDDGVVELRGPAPGPAGEAALQVAPGLVIAFDAADLRVVTRVEIAEDADSLDVANLLGPAGTTLLAADTGASALLDDPHATVVREDVARLALLLLARNVPFPSMGSHSWSFEALVLGERVADLGFDLSDLLGTEAERAAAALLTEFGRIGPRPAAEELAVRAAHIAVRVLDPLDPNWFALAELSDDLPDLAADEWTIPTASIGRPSRMPSLIRRLGEEGPLDRTYPLLWRWVDAELLPWGEAFAAAITATLDLKAARVIVQCALRERPERAVFARVVERDTSKVVSMFALLFDDGSWAGDGPMPPITDDGNLRIEVVGSLGAPVLAEPVLLRRLGAQWGLLALDAERQGDYAVASVRWMRSSEHYVAAQEDAAATTALRYGEACLRGADDPELIERRVLPFESEVGPEPSGEQA